MWSNLSTLLGIAAPLALMIALWVLAQISRRFGEVTRRPPHYRAFYVALGLMVPPLLVRLLAIGLSERQHADLGGNTLEAALHDMPLALGVVLAVIVAWRYWGWLVTSQQETPAPRPRTAPHRTGKSVSS